jgi:hypothetical protein
VADRLNFTSARGMRASWSVHPTWPGKFIGVIKELGTDAWMWNCNRGVHPGRTHETRNEALACARERITKEVARRG